MTIQWTGTGGLFTRLGALAAALAEVNSYQGTTLAGRDTTVEAQYDQNFALVEGIESQLTASQNACSSWLSEMQAIAEATVNWMVYQDNPLLSNTDIGSSLREVVRQMKVNSQTVKKCTCTISTSNNSTNVGNGVAVGSVYRNDGLVNESLLAEKLTALCTQDENDNSSFAGNETFTVNGQVGFDVFDWRYQTGGSASQTTLTVIDGGVDNANGNLLTNGDFESWTSNVPNNWTVAVGASQVQESTAQHYTGSASCQFVGDGSTLTAIEQQFNSSTGTAGTVSALTQYAFNLWVRCDTVAGQNGVLVVDLVDENGTVINDYSGNANSVSLTLSGLTAGTWTAFNGAFRLPQVMPTSVSIRVRLSTALNAGTNLWLDRLAMGEMTLLYTGGPSLALFSGSNNFYDGDYISITTTNDRGGASSLKTFQTVFERFFDISQYGLLLPSSASPTISDTLIA